MTPEFVPGVKISEFFYWEVVKPILARRFPRLEYSAGRLGHGSDVLGFDTPMSTDHGWGPIVEIYLPDRDCETTSKRIARILASELPYEFRGYSTNFKGWDWAPKPIREGPVDHRVTCLNVNAFVTSYRPVNPVEEMTVLDWLTIPQQELRLIRSGKVFHDGLGRLDRIRKRLRWYPRDVWLYLMAAQWRRISQEEAFMGRCGDVGDELGSRIVASRMVHDLMCLCFLMQREYAPYAKWFGTAFSRLRCAKRLTTVLADVLEARSWRRREECLSAAYEAAARMHNSLEITKPLSTKVRRFHGRRYMVIDGERFSEAIHRAIRSKEVKRLPRYVGSVDQFVKSTDVLDEADRRRRLGGVYA